MDKKYLKELKELQKDHRWAQQELKKLEEFELRVRPIHAELRLELETASRLVDSLFAPILDITKATIIVTIPALIAVININFSQDVNKSNLVGDLKTILLLAITIHLLTLFFKIKQTVPFINNSSSRLSLYATFLESHNLSRRVQDIGQRIATLKKKKRPSKKKKL